MSDVLEGLDGSTRERIEALRAAGRFFWIDVSSTQVSPEDLRDALGISAGACAALLAFGSGGRGMHTRKLFAGDGLVVFPFTSYLESASMPKEALGRSRAVEVHVLVSRDYVLTLHEGRFSLPTELAPYLPEGLGDRYSAYSIVEAMVATAFAALYEVELTLDHLAVRSTILRGARVRMATLRGISSRLSEMRRRVAPLRGLFERIGLQLGRVDGRDEDDERSVDMLDAQVNRLVDGIDSAADALATLIDLRLNETTYWLTVVATIFLPLTFITGFFGMNFNWMIDQIDTQLAFWLLGIALPVVGVALIVRLIVRGSPVDVSTDAGSGRRRARVGGARRRSARTRRDVRSGRPNDR